VTWLAVIAAGLVLARLAVAVVRFARLSPAGRRYWLPARWARLRWRWFCRNAGLGYLDRHHRRQLRPRLPFTTAVRVQEEPVHLMRWPRARFYADNYGLVAKVVLIPKVGRAEFEAAAPYIADAWRCHRVQIGQPRSGRLLIRGLRRDPLAEPLAMADVPAGVYGVRKTAAENLPPGGEKSAPEIRTAGSDFRVYLGRDEWGDNRWAQLANITAAVVAGVPGAGKTTLANSLLCQLAPSPAVRLAIADGQGGADFEPWRQRAYAYAGDDRADAAALLEDVHAEMRHRFATVAERTGHRNAWRTGPTEAFPLLFLVVDEAQTYLDEGMVKGDRLAEAHVRTCRAMLGQLVRRGRSVMLFTLIMAHKPTTDSVPSFISANAGLRLSFAVQTIDAAVSVLGDTIRQYPTVSPVTLQGPEGVGVLTAQLRTGTDPYVRLRVPEVTEEAAERRALETVRPGKVLAPPPFLPLTR
jgi:DNA segregation ATPase FtsK/SpoIIIE, S-DNA-T family